MKVSFRILAVGLALALVGCANPAGDTKKDPTPQPTDTGKYLFHADGSDADIAHSYDNWSCGSTNNYEATDSTYANVISSATGTKGWGVYAAAVAFTQLGDANIDQYTTLKFKIKLTNFTDIKVKLPEVEHAYTPSEALADGWYQMSVPLADFAGHVTPVTQVAILNNSDVEGSFLVTDVAFY